MRVLTLFLMTTLALSSPLWAADGTGFETFYKSREVVATLYFQANADTLTKTQQDILSSNISRLRKLQNNGRMIRVEGFSSLEGDREDNFRLSFFRARTVADLIAARGLPAEITLTGYGDLRAKDLNPKERRVEIASYVKPVGLKRVRVAKKKTDRIEAQISPGFSRISHELQGIDSLSIEEALKRKLEDRERNVAEGEHKYLPLSSPGVSQAPTLTEPIIDALTIEQAIMEKIGSVAPEPSGSVSQVNTDF